MKAKKILTKERMLKDEKYIRTILLFSIFFLAGLAVYIWPITSWEGDWKILLINSAAASILAVPFCYFIAYRNISNIVRDVIALKKDRIFIIEDVVTSRHSLMRDGTRSSCQIELQDYAKRTGKCIWVDGPEYNRARKGDMYYVVYIETKKREYFSGAYAAKKYELDDSLRKFVRKSELQDIADI